MIGDHEAGQGPKGTTGSLLVTLMLSSAQKERACHKEKEEGKRHACRVSRLRASVVLLFTDWVWEWGRGVKGLRPGASPQFLSWRYVGLWLSVLLHRFLLGAPATIK